MAPVTTITSKEYSSGIKIVTVNMKAGVGAALFTSASLGAERGKELVNVFTAPGATGPTDNSDLSVVDSITSRDLVATNGPNSVDNAASNYVAPETESIVIGNLTVAVANNAVNDAETSIILVFKAKY